MQTILAKKNLADIFLFDAKERVYFFVSMNFLILHKFTGK